MIGDMLCGGVILLEEARRHHQCLAGVVESLTRSGVDGKRIRWPNIDARQIANRVVVFGVAQSPRQHDSRITRRLASLLQHQRAEHSQDFRPLGRFRLFGIRRRHLFASDKRDDVLPLPIVRCNRLRRRVSSQIKLSFRLLLVVALDAESFHEGKNRVVKRIRPFDTSALQQQCRQDKGRRQSARSE